MTTATPDPDGGDLGKKFDEALQGCLDRRAGTQAVTLLVHGDPLRRFCREFNDRMDGVSGRYIDRAYLQPQAALAAMVYAGKLADVPAVMKMTRSVLAMTALHYRALSYRRDNPRADFGSPFGADGGLLVAYGVFDLDRLAAAASCPADAAGRSERLRVMLAEARAMDPLLRSVFCAVRSPLSRGLKLSDALREAARRVGRDDRGRVVSLRPAPAAPGEPAAPPEAAVRQVRRLFQEACRYVACRAYFRGYLGDFPS